jgi:anti-sigma factor RsiW
VTCDDLHGLLHPYADGELDLVRGLEVEQHLRDCPACSAALDRQRAVHAALADPALYHRAPAGLRQRVQAALRPAAPARVGRREFPWRALAVAASLAFLALLAWDALRLASAPSAEDLLAQEVVSSFVRSQLPGKEPDVLSSDKHTVKPWFIGKVAVAPPVEDLAAEGFPLVGGRLDYVDNHNTAALVYGRHKHVINLLVWPAPSDAEEAPRALTRQGYHLIRWAHAGSNFWAVSDLNEAELQEFVRLIRR